MAKPVISKMTIWRFVLVSVLQELVLHNIIPNVSAMNSESVHPISSGIQAEASSQGIAKALGAYSGTEMQLDKESENSFLQKADGDLSDESDEDPGLLDRIFEKLMIGGKESDRIGELIEKNKARFSTPEEEREGLTKQIPELARASPLELKDAMTDQAKKHPETAQCFDFTTDTKARLTSESQLPKVRAFVDQQTLAETLLDMYTVNRLAKDRFKKKLEAKSSQSASSSFLQIRMQANSASAVNSESVHPISSGTAASSQGNIISTYISSAVWVL